MGRPLIPDTNILIEVERGRVSLEDIISRDDTILLPAVVVAEFEVGVEMASAHIDATIRRATLDAFFDSAARVLDFTRETAHHFAVLAAHAIRSGTRRGQFDLVIAAHALESGAAIISTDFRARFGDLPGVHSATVDRHGDDPRQREEGP